MIVMMHLDGKSKHLFIAGLITRQRLKGGGLILLSDKYLEKIDDGFLTDFLRDTLLRL